MILTKEQQAILDGERGETLSKVMKTLVMYGDAFEAEKLVPITSKYNHLVTSFGLKVMAPVYDLMQQILDAESKDELVKVIADLHDSGESSFFGTFVMSDLMDSESQILYIGQGGLGIGDRDYYTEAENAEIKKGYEKFLTRVFELAGIPIPETAAANALAVEDVLAINSWTSVQERDMEKLYNPMSTEEIESK